MRFLMSVIDHETGMATDEEMAAIDAFNARLQADGHWVMAAGLEAPERAAVVDSRGPGPVVTAGPAVASPQYTAGFWIIDAPSAEAARALAAQGSRACNRIVEVRAFLAG